MQHNTSFPPQQFDLKLPRDPSVILSQLPMEYKLSVPSYMKGVFGEIGKENAHEVMAAALDIVNEWEVGARKFDGDDDCVRVGRYPVYKRVEGSYALDIYLRKLSSSTLEFHVEQSILGA